MIEQLFWLGVEEGYKPITYSTGEYHEYFKKLINCNDLHCVNIGIWSILIGIWYIHNSFHDRSYAIMDISNTTMVVNIQQPLDEQIFPGMKANDMSHQVYDLINKELSLYDTTLYDINDNS